MIDKSTIYQVLCGLMLRPSYLMDSERYNLSPDDFTTLFEKYIFAAIYNLQRNGAETISIVDIDNYFDTHSEAKELFEKNNGIEILQDALDVVQVENFPFYYQRLKKFNIIKDIKKMGFDTSQIYCEDLTNPKAAEINDIFENMQADEIFSFYKRKLMGVESKYQSGASKPSTEISSGLRDLIKKMKMHPEVGARLQGKDFNTICRGARAGKFYIRTASSGTGKTRSAVGDACMLSFPIRYNSLKGTWEFNGASETTLFIATEQELEEIQTLVLAYLTDINEEVILYGNYTEEEEERIRQGILIMEQYSKNFIVKIMSNPNITQLKAVVRENWLKYDIQNLFYDYIFSSPSLLSEFRDLKVREDVALSMLSSALKELAVELKIFVMSSTQTNAKIEEEKGIKNEVAIRGSRAIIDKCDVACIICRVTKEEEELISDIPSSLTPNQVMDVYKVRRGRYTNVKIWSNVDLGTCRKEDLFITTASYGPVEGYKTIDFVFEDENEEDLEFLNKLNQNNIEIKREKESETSIDLESLMVETKEKGIFDGLY